MTELASISRRNLTSAGVQRYWPELAVGAIWLAAFALLWGIPVSHDVVWQLWIARHLNAGVDLYTWIMEVNPPLWYWMAQPVDLLAAWTGLSDTTVLVAIVLLLVGAALALVGALSAERPPAERAWLLGGTVFALIWACLSDFGQREHLALIGLVPYALLLARRADGHNVAWGLALLVGLLATPMIALKHYFILAPVLLEAWLLWRQRHHWRPFRPETLLLAFGAVVYAAAVLLFARQYITDLVPLLQLSYGDLRSAIARVFINRMTLTLPVAALYFWHFRHELKAQAQAMGVLAVAFLASYWLQFKGWEYHIDPVISCIILSMVAHLATRPATPKLRRIEVLVMLMIPAISLAPALVEGPYVNAYERATNRLLERAEPGMTAVMLTTKPSKIWPMAENKGLIWPSRYFHFWMMQSVANSQLSGEPLKPALAAYVDQVRLETVDDFLCNPPDILIDDAQSIDFVEFNILDFFLEEPKFAAIFSAYEPYGHIGPFTAYQRARGLPPPDGLDCITLLPRH